MQFTGEQGASRLSVQVYLAVGLARDVDSGRSGTRLGVHLQRQTTDIGPIIVVPGHFIKLEFGLTAVARRGSCDAHMVNLFLDWLSRAAKQSVESMQNADSRLPNWPIMSSSKPTRQQLYHCTFLLGNAEPGLRW